MRSRGSRRSAPCSPPPRPSAPRGACSTTRSATPASAASSAARSGASRRCATCSPTCTCATRARGRRCCTPRPRSTRTPARRCGRPRSPRPTSGAPPARSRTARCRSSAGSRSRPSTRPTGSCGGSSCATRSSATPPTTSARSVGRLPLPQCRSRSADMRSDTTTTRATEIGFGDPTSQRLEAIATGAEPEIVGPALAAALHDPRWERCDVALISGGKSNLTYRVASDAGEVVLRRPPLGHILPTAHDMVREHRVLLALESTTVPVPRVLHLGRADGPLGVDFYVMERVLGHVCRNALPPAYADGPEPRAAIGAALVDVLADLHAVDPAAVGLDGFGRPAGFVERQLRRWSQQWEASKTGDLPALDALRDELVRTLPPQRAAAIVHGDYRLDNTVLHPTSPGRIVAVLDWEMSTLGDPLTDLGTLLAYWSEEVDGPVLAAARVMAPV